jgi:hypothetical protein
MVYIRERRSYMNRILTAILLGFCMLCLTPGISMASAGGPDAFGYQYIDSYEGGGPGYHLIDIHGTGTLVYVNEADDAYSDSIGIGFTFPFYGLNYSQFYVSTNGFISFGEGSDSYNWDNAVCFPSNLAPDAGNTLAMIAPLWADLVVDNSSYTPDIIDPGDPGIYYEYFAESPHPDFTGPCLVVEWYKTIYYTDYYGSVNTFNVEMIIFSDGKILFQYGPGDYYDGVIGIQNHFGTSGLSYVCSPEDVELSRSLNQDKTAKQKVRSNNTAKDGIISGGLAVLFGPPAITEKTEKPATEDAYTKYKQYTGHPKDKKFLENCFITVAAGEANGLFPLLMALACALGGFLTRKRIS